MSYVFTNSRTNAGKEDAEERFYGKFKKLQHEHVGKQHGNTM